VSAPTEETWSEAHARVSARIQQHPRFPHLVREVAVAEQSSHPRLAWLRRNSMTYGMWASRGMPDRRTRRLSHRARVLASRIASSLEIQPTDRPAEAEARVWVEARQFVRARKTGR
jgi:hypothetical protein